MPPNKELKLTNLERIGGSQLNSGVRRTLAEHSAQNHPERARSSSRVETPLCEFRLWWIVVGK
jgi:hypothetical protein